MQIQNRKFVSYEVALEFISTNTIIPASTTKFHFFALNIQL